MTNEDLAYLAGYLDSRMRIDTKFTGDPENPMAFSVKILCVRSDHKPRHIAGMLDELGIKFSENYNKFGNFLEVSDETSLFILLSHVKPWSRCMSGYIESALSMLMK